jgi:hypothetical protein
MRFRNWLSTYGQTSSGSNNFYEDKPLPQLPSALDEEHNEVANYYGLDANGSIERIIRLGHMWELGDRFARSKARREGAGSL